MTSRYLPTSKLLDQGGTCYINKSGYHWSIDVFDAEWDKRAPTDPIYHAYYDNEIDARADFDSWKAWPENT